MQTCSFKRFLFLFFLHSFFFTSRPLCCVIVRACYVSLIMRYTCIVRKTGWALQYSQRFFVFRLTLCLFVSILAYRKISARESLFRCGHGNVYIRDIHRCNGIQECPDASDERGCDNGMPFENKLFRYGFFRAINNILRRNPPGHRVLHVQNYVPKLFTSYCKLLCCWFKYTIKRNHF